jgi:hypothetical protein
MAGGSLADREDAHQRPAWTSTGPVDCVVRRLRRPAAKSRVLPTLDLKEMLPVLPPTSNPRVAGSTPARRTIKSITYKSRFPILARIARLGVMSLVSAHVGRCLMVSISI